MNNDPIINVERVTINKIENSTNINLQVLCSISGKYQTILKELKLLEKPIIQNDEKQIYQAFVEQIPVLKQQPINLQINYIEIENAPHLKIIYNKFDGGNWLIIYLLKVEDSQGNYTPTPIETHKI